MFKIKILILLFQSSILHKQKSQQLKTVEQRLKHAFNKRLRQIGKKNKLT